MPTVKPDPARVSLLQDWATCEFGLKLEDFYLEWLGNHKDTRFKELAKRCGVPVEKIDKAREKNEAGWQAAIFNIWCQVPPVEFSFLDLHPERGLTEDQAESGAT